MVSKYFVWFTIFSFMGWIYESIYCTVRTHHWQNRGFLFGPLCPIYGVGAIACVWVCGGVWFGKMSMGKIFIICFLGSIVLEYSTHFILEKLFHAVWWDYSNEPFNIKGRICLPASIGFGVAGIFVVNYIYPFTDYITKWLPAMGMEIVSLIFMAVLGADIALTVSALTSFMKNVQAVEASVNRQMEEFYQSIEGGYKDKMQVVSSKREELTKSATESMAMLLNLVQKHALHSVQEFRYGESLNGISSRVAKLEKGLVKRARAVKNVASEKAGELKDNVVEKISRNEEAQKEKE